MFCPKCSRFTMPDEHIGKTGKMNRLCCKCLGNEKLDNIYFLEHLEEIPEAMTFPSSILVLPIDCMEDQTLEEFGQDLMQMIFEEKEIQYR